MVIVQGGNRQYRDSDLRPARLTCAQSILSLKQAQRVRYLYEIGSTQR